jgi:nitric oxide reductase subunit C
MQTKSAARNIFYGGSLFFFLILVALTAQSHGYIRNVSTNEATLTESVIRGKRVWEENTCINCHTLLGEGAYFAPELGNACIRMGGGSADYKKGGAAAKTVLKDGKEAIMAWIESMPTGVEGRRQMPNFHLSKAQLSDVADFLCWSSTIKTQNWPPNDAG